jgi:hypothetical protein
LILKVENKGIEPLAEAEAEKTRLAALQKARQDSINQAAVAEKARKVQAEAQAKAAAEADRST